ncbi:MAG: PAS domain S-box protein [Candidatus Thorarchaeota archaeon]|nr:MAG: PAS domain S-box protein [Candidatus Thorarchaeota archaeon]
MKESETLFKAIFNDSPIPINIFDVDGNYVTGNRALLELVGVKTDDDLRVSTYSEIQMFQTM